MIIKNAPNEGPGTIEGFLRQRRAPFSVLGLYEGGAAPSVGGFGSLVVLGGPMGVYEMERHPHLSVCARAVEEAMKSGVRVLGICLGAQIMAHVLGADVYRGKAGAEKGWMDVELTPEGVTDPVVGGLAEPGSRAVKVLQWHGDTFDLPRGAVRLASSAMYANQAFRHGDDAYALQFHIEATPRMIDGWFSDEEAALRQKTKSDTGAYFSHCAMGAERLYERFFG